ncbi:MAG TPA: N-acetylmuramoyl-L-alanine amidase-like domain-containing protein [Drouetiella sp.]|jgi:Protein of unknown function (DUF1460)
MARKFKLKICSFEPNSKRFVDGVVLATFTSSLVITAWSQLKPAFAVEPETNSRTSISTQTAVTTTEPTAQQNQSASQDKKASQDKIASQDKSSNDASDAIFNRIMTRANKENWKQLPIGELMGKVARELEGTAYVGGVLDRNKQQEICTVDLSALDCVTFFESTLDLARTIKKGGSKPADLTREVSFTRYRGGKPTNYTSRLHYTTDWFHDNEHKHVVEPLQKLPGAAPFRQKVGFMSSHPQSYSVLVANPEFVSIIKKQEVAINKRHLNYIPLNKIAGIEPLLKTGDIVGICTDLPGLDIVHTGIIFRDQAGVPHFMDASSKKSNMKVTIESGPISGTAGYSPHNIGIMLARPLEP